MHRIDNLQRPGGDCWCRSAVGYVSSNSYTHCDAFVYSNVGTDSTVDVYATDTCSFSSSYLDSDFWSHVAAVGLCDASSFDRVALNDSHAASDFSETYDCSANCKSHNATRGPNGHTDGSPDCANT
jgi:hypothetical protein